MSSSRPSWLPDLLHTNGEWDTVLAQLYQVFDRDFKSDQCLFQGLPVHFDKRILDGTEEEGFWHLVTRIDRETNERVLDPRRAERLGWCRALLTHSTEAGVLVWDYEERKGKIRTYVWLEDWNYVVILEKKIQRIGQVAFLVTAYFVDGEWTSRSLRRKYNQRVP